MNICLYGSGSRKTGRIYLDEGFKLGQRIADEGHTLIFGGGDTGMMGAVARGVNKNSGKLIGIAPKWINNFEKLSNTCTEFIYVSEMDERKNKFIEHSDAFIIAPGGIGTMDEFFEVITLKKLKKHDKEIIIFNINGFYDKLLEMIHQMDVEGFLYKQEELFKVAESIEEIFNKL